MDRPRESTGTTVAYAVHPLGGVYSDSTARFGSRPSVDRPRPTCSASKPHQAGMSYVIHQLTGNLMLRNDVGAANVWSSTIVPTGGWHKVQVHILVGGSSSRTDVWYDGTKVPALSQTLNLGATGVGDSCSATTPTRGPTRSCSTTSPLAPRSSDSAPDTLPPTVPTGLGGVPTGPTRVDPRGPPQRTTRELRATMSSATAAPIAWDRSQRIRTSPQFPARLTATRFELATPRTTYPRSERRRW